MYYSDLGLILSWSSYLLPLPTLTFLKIQRYLHSFLSSYICGQIMWWCSLNHPSPLHNRYLTATQNCLCVLNFFLTARRSVESEVFIWACCSCVWHSPVPDDCCRVRGSGCYRRQTCRVLCRQHRSKPSRSPDPWFRLFKVKDAMPGFLENTKNCKKRLC